MASLKYGANDQTLLSRVGEIPSPGEKPLHLVFSDPPLPEPSCDAGSYMGFKD